jgi:hypothetical protein
MIAGPVVEPRATGEDDSGCADGTRVSALGSTRVDRRWAARSGSLRPVAADLAHPVSNLRVVAATLTAALSEAFASRIWSSRSRRSRSGRCEHGLSMPV